MAAFSFDRLARSVAAAPSRRTVTRAVVGAIAGLLGGTLEAAAAPCPKGKQRCKQTCIPKRACCTTAQCRPTQTGKVCRHRRCVCRRGTKPCQDRCLHPAAACPPAPAAACPGPGTGGVAPSPPMRLAQTFTEPNGGRLLGVELVIDNDGDDTGTYQVQLNTVDAAGVPLNNTLATALRPANQVGSAPGPVSFPFPTPPALVPGQRYAIVLSRLDSTGQFNWGTIDSASCAGGQLFLSFTASGSFVPAGFGPELDGVYQTFVVP